MVTNSIIPLCHSDRIVSMRLPLKSNQHHTLQCLCPNSNGRFCAKKQFFQISQTFEQHWALGDFNARVGRDPLTWQGVLGRHGVENCDDNGRLLNEFYTESQLSITNTIIQQNDRLKTTWMHPLPKHWHLPDCVCAPMGSERRSSHESNVQCGMLH